LVESQKSFFWPPMFNIELWRPRETFLALCPFLPLNAQSFIFNFFMNIFFYNEEFIDELLCFL
jgi:hypothetical protein